MKKEWWANINFDEFSGHYIEMTDKQIADDVRKSIVCLLKHSTEGDSFGAFMVRKAKDRIAGRRETNSMNGKKGAEARWGKNTAVDASTRKDEEDRKSGTSTANLSEAIAGMFPTSRNKREGSGSVLRGGCIENGPSRIPATAQQLYDLADRLSVDRDDARQCWEATKERHGKTKDGKEIKDFPAYMVKWCKTTEAKRKSA